MRHYQYFAIFLFQSLFLLSGCQGPGVAAYHRGNLEYANGQYQRSFANYLYAARHGITPAQYAVGYQYYNGQGTRHNEVKSIRWFEKAKNNSVRANYALNLIQSQTPRQPWTLGLPYTTSKKLPTPK